jgi:hypothetical protein
LCNALAMLWLFRVARPAVTLCTHRHMLADARCKLLA